RYGSCQMRNSPALPACQVSAAMGNAASATTAATAAHAARSTPAATSRGAGTGRLSADGVEPLVDPGAPVGGHGLVVEHQHRRGVDEIVEAVRQAFGGQGRGIHPVGGRDDGLEFLAEDEGEEFARELRVVAGGEHAGHLDLQVVPLLELRGGEARSEEHTSELQ